MNEQDEALDDDDIEPSIGFLFSHPSHLIALGFGSGLLPIIPGTAGTVFAWLIYVLFTSTWPEIFTPLTWEVLIVLGFGLGIWACGKTGQDVGKPDHGCMVWDEIIAFWLVLLFVMPCGLFMQLCAFILFRFFDMLKPPPIKYFDENIKGGFGVMWDDVLAAFYTLLVIALWRVNFS